VTLSALMPKGQKLVLPIPLPPGIPLLQYDAHNTDGFLNSLRVDGLAFSPWANLGSVLGADIEDGFVPTQPTFSAIAQAGKLNNLPAVRGNGSSRLSINFGADIPQPLTYGMVFMSIDVSVDEVMFQGGNDGVNGHEIFHTGNKLEFYGGTFSGDTGLVIQSGKWHMLTLEINGSSSIIRLDGTQAGPFNCGTDPLGGAGLLASSGGFAMNGGIAECLVYPTGAQSAASLEPYFRCKYGAGFPQ
jgi:hypothetical protein